VRGDVRGRLAGEVASERRERRDGGHGPTDEVTEWGP
jgi:hypothetical protein